ncbi:MAG: RluA family pseudouridine synthase [Labilithrix sp.]|nr:RluA family pseudouridine synthase [Labilithrix sp.]
MRPPREKRWVVREGDGTRVGEIVKKAGDDPQAAIAEGRVFVGKKRVASASAPVKVGDEVRIGAPGAAARRGRVLFERDGIVACVKEAGIPTVPDHAGSVHSLVAQVAAEIGRSADELVVTSRLDREVSGVVLFAVTPEAEARLREARARGAYHRRYVAIAATGGREVAPDPWDAPVADKPSRTLWSPVAFAGDFALLAVSPITGRTHQIRVHASRAGLPLLGDADYGGPSRVTLESGRVVTLSRIALHAARVSAAGLTASAPIPTELGRVWTELGGRPEAWDIAVSCELEPSPK